MFNMKNNKKELDGISYYWWLRSANIIYDNIVGYVYTNGGVYPDNCYYGNGVAPTCII